jgi:secretion/DNA translocation related CpaE-like protein
VSPNGSPTAVALVTHDPRLAADVRRLCAVAGLDLEVAGAPRDVTRCWRRGLLVLVDAEMATTVDRSAVSRRPGVLLVASDAECLETWRAATRLGAEQVLVLPADERLLLDRIAAAAQPEEPVGSVVGVVPGSGGAGATTLAAALAVAAARSRSVTLIDADPAGGGVDLLFGAERTDGCRWSDLAGVRGTVDAPALAGSLPCVDGVRLLSADRPGAEIPADAMAALLPAARRSSALVVVDLPHHLEETALVAAAACTALVVVAFAEVRATAAAARVVAAARGACDDVRLVVRSGPRSRVRARDVGAAVDLPVLAVIAGDPAVAAAADRGELAGHARTHGLGSAVDSVLTWVVGLGAADVGAA